jgi:hypothetical protein
MTRSLFFDGFNEATDDDFEIDGDIGLLQGARAVFKVNVDWNWRGMDRSDADSVTCELIRLEATQKPHGKVMDRAQILNAFGLSAVHRAERSAEGELMEQFSTGVAA